MPVSLALRATAAAGVLLALAATPAPARVGPIERHYVPLAAFADTLAKRSLERAHAHVDSVAVAAMARGDRARAAAANLWRAKRYAAHDYRFETSLPYFAKVLPVARALRDTFALATLHGRRATGAHLAGRPEVAWADYEASARLARRAGLREIEGLAHRGLGDLGKLAGRYDRARRELELAVRLLPEASFEHLHSRLVLGEVLVRTGRPDEAEARFEDVLAEARRRNNRWTIAAALHDLANIAYEQGDMAEADRKWAQAAAHYDTLTARGTINAAAGIDARINRAHALLGLDRTADARALLERQLEACAEVEDPSMRTAVLSELARVDRRTGRIEAAERTLRRVRAASREWDVREEEKASLELVALLRGSGRLGPADDLLDSLLVRRATMEPDNVAAALVERSAIRRARGRPAEALASAREAERITRSRSANPSLAWLDAAVELGRCQREAGRPDEAAATLTRAAQAWEKWRARISNFEWRERAGSGLAGLFAELGRALLDPRRRVPEARRAGQAFDALQGFQGRTLEERMRGAGLAGASMLRRVTADSLRARVLRPGEALLDLVALPETTLAFVVTREGIRARGLPGTDRLDPLFRDWRDAMLGGAPEAVVERGLARLSAELLAPLAPALSGPTRLVVTGGGPVALWPIAALSLPGEARALGQGREIATAPSATMFTLLRRRAGAAPASPRLLALGRTTDAGGRALPGAEREMDMLGHAFAGVTVRAHAGDRTVPALLDGAARFDALHLSAHAEAAPGTPWRSGFLLGRGEGEEAYLRASKVARMRLKARLAVLSGCQSAGALALPGEGALGLSSGFLCAGTTTVVATLWPVEDRAAERWMNAFYAALAAGRSAAGAAGDAREALRLAPGTANPRDWAAFVVIGEPGTTLRLRPRGRA